MAVVEDTTDQIATIDKKTIGTVPCHAIVGSETTCVRSVPMVPSYILT